MLTGAGISAESGVPTFREVQRGLWAKYDPLELATPEAFVRNPELVWRWYHWRRELVAGVEPNEGHRALVDLAGRAARLTLITQNVDGLHQRAGSKDVIEFHGNLFKEHCVDNCGINVSTDQHGVANYSSNVSTDQHGVANCSSNTSTDQHGVDKPGFKTSTNQHRVDNSGHNASTDQHGVDNHGVKENDADRTDKHGSEADSPAVGDNNVRLPHCPGCGALIRPAVVWFGEAIPELALEHAFRAAADCDVFLSIGTSSQVYPAAGLADIARQSGAVTVEINPEKTGRSSDFDWVLTGEAGTVLPELVESLARNEGAGET